ncbi:hypothetical protein [Rhizosphaericola mali]|uniref:Uncharacterized protein n=1 Tax=Rhizosphaericola mali TaxID=2545455 RepID=A0A5P2G2L5_9BACT|nr:hypothetical protein [Rhizosphaericola mali]QES90054.1 hypothetical protein E0W69_015790 [Rhizosphaericola mali]
MEITTPNETLGVILSKNGKAYEVSLENDSSILKGESNSVNVDWEIGTHGRCPSEVVTKVHVESYELKKASWSIYNYVLYFKANKSGEYYFEDASGDVYKVSVSFTSYKHKLSFDSKNPSIKKITYVEY